MVVMCQQMVWCWPPPYTRSIDEHDCSTMYNAEAGMHSVRTPFLFLTATLPVHDPAHSCVPGMHAGDASHLVSKQ
jgi:hypothetical protein